MTQHKKHSFLEALSNTLIGVIVQLAVTPLVYYITGVKATPTQIGITTLLFTIISVIRNYIIRRFFNKLKHKQ